MKFLFTLLMILASLVLHAQSQYTTTFDGKCALLRSNGTWEFVDKQSAATKNAETSAFASKTTFNK